MPEGQAAVCRRAGRVRMPRLPESKCFSRPARLLRPVWVSAGLFAFNPGLDFRKKPDIRNRFKRRARGGKLRQETFAKIPLHPTAEAQTQASGCFLFPISLFSPRIPDNQASGPPFRRKQAHLACCRFQKVQTHRLQMALRTHFNQPEIGCPGVAEFTVQRTEALFDHITGL